MTMTTKRIIDIDKICDTLELRMEDIAAGSGLSFSTLQRWKKDTTGIKLDNVHALLKFINPYANGAYTIDNIFEQAAE